MHPFDRERRTPRAPLLAALLTMPSCVHEVPVRIEPDDTIAIVSDVPVQVRARNGEPVTIDDDWSLVVGTHGYQFTTVPAPLTLTHSDDALHVRGPTNGSGQPIEFSFPDSQIERVWLERPNVGGTVALIAAGTVLVVGSIWGMYQLLTIGEH